MTKGPGRDQRPRDLFVGIVILVFCAAAYAITLGFDRAPPALAQNVQPATFPRLVIIVIAALTVWLMIAGLREAEIRRRAIPPAVWISALVMLAFVLAFQWLGPLPSMIALCIGLPFLWGERRWRIVLPFGIVFPVAIYLLFAELLEVYFEPSPLVFW